MYTSEATNPPSRVPTSEPAKKALLACSAATTTSAASKAMAPEVAGAVDARRAGQKGG